MELDPILDRLQSSVREHFDENEQVLSFEEFLEHFVSHPCRHLRTAPQYLLEMFDYFGTQESSRIGMEAHRFGVFDLEEVGKNTNLIGQERVQEDIYQYLQSFAKRGEADKMLLLHGPNGSGKTTVIENIVLGLERFSRAPEGVLMTFSWLFTDREGKLDRIGFEAVPEDEDEQVSYAHLDAHDISSRFGCELRCSPLFLLPRERRESFVRDVLAGSKPPHPHLNYTRFLEGDLCQKCMKIYESLLIAYQGDWRKVLRHVRVERYFVSKRYRRGAVSIEPQGNVDGGTQPITSEHSWSIPVVLRNVTLYQPVGDIVDANRGILEYSDFLKRPIEMNKYLLTTCERGTASLSNCMVYLDLLIAGTANEKQLSLFKRSPDFSSFKGRMELIAVPYLLRVSIEAELYRRQIRAVAKGRDVAPHTAEVAALWSVLTRLRRPCAENYEEPMRGVVTKLTPVEKANLYDSGEVPAHFSEEEKKVLRAGIREVREEFEEHEAEFEGIFGAEYEGRRGVSPREMLTLLSRAAESGAAGRGAGGSDRCLTPMAVFDAIEELVKDSSLYDFLRITSDDGYHDVRELLTAVKTEYLSWVTQEVYGSIELIDESEYDRIFHEYFRHVKAFDSGEKVFNSSTNAYDSPSTELLERIEGLVEHDEDPEHFRSNIMTRIAAWSLDNPQQPLDYPTLFPEIYQALKDNFYSERKRVLTLIEQDILKYGTDEFDLLSDGEKEQVVKALAKMRDEFGYTEDGARDVIAWVLRSS